MIAAVIAASGQGRRLGYPQGKQFISIGGKPLLYHTLKAFLDYPEIEVIITVVNEKDEGRLKELLKNFENAAYRKAVYYCFGGRERYESVFKGILKAKEVLGDSFESSIILIHDGARPLVNQKIISAVIEGVKEYGACVCALPMTDTVKVVEDGRVISTPDRSRLYSAQTPQGFTGKIIWESYQKLKNENFLPTDDSSIVERAGFEVHVVPGSSKNIKLTTEDDLMLIERMLFKAKGMRVGIGFDVHKLVEGRKLYLGGVEIPFEKGLLGHSDGDVLIHAISDALLGAAGLPDIGELFPDTDPEIRGISSLRILSRVRKMISEKGFSIAGLDSVIICERPKLAPYKEGIKSRIAEILEIDAFKVSVKGKTAEGLGVLGSEEAIASFAVAIIEEMD